MKDIKIAHHTIGLNHSPFIIAEMSGNHNQSLERAFEIVDAAAVKERIGRRDAVIIDNRTGGVILGDIASKAQPDGYTLLLYDNSFAIWPKLYPKLPFDPVKDFAPVVLVLALAGCSTPQAPEDATLDEFARWHENNFI